MAGNSAVAGEPGDFDLKVTGQGHIPGPWPSFAACGFRRDVSSALGGLGFKAPTPIQAYCWPIIGAGRDVVGVAETGSGKTLAFLAPAFDWLLRWDRPDDAPSRYAVNPRRGPVILVLAPTRELATQIQVEAGRLGDGLNVRACCLYGGTDFKPQIAALKQRPQVVVGCPGRFLDLVQRRQVSVNDVGFFTLDEADRMLDMGFEEQVRDIINRLSKNRQTVMFTATWPPQIQSIANAYTWDPVHVQQGEPGELSCNSRVHQEVCLCRTQAEKVQAVVSFLKKLEPNSRTIIFVNTKAVISEVCTDLKRFGFPSVALHADLDQQDRERSLEEFRGGQCFLTVATDVASRGLDVRDVRAVVCFDAGRDKETHVHRVGRTGRAGANGRALTLILTTRRTDLRMAADIFAFMRDAGQTVCPELVASVSALSSKENEGTQDTAEFVMLPESSDEELEEEDAFYSSRDSVSAWHDRLRVQCETELLRVPLTGPGTDAAVPSQDYSTRASPSDIGSIMSGTTYLQNPVEHLFGHAAAKDISVRLCRETVQSGCRLITTDVQCKSGGGPKPYRWMAMRRVFWDDIVSSSSDPSLSKEKPDIEFVWHMVIHEFSRSRAGKTRILTNYFKSNIGMVYDYVADAFQLGDDDDPELIKAAVSDESISTLLRLYFETGDTQNPQHYFTMAKMSLWPAGSLLHHCCESGFFRCVDFLLRYHSPQTAPRDKPWLQLVDPLWQEKQWRNSAFHSASWAGQADVMSVLSDWAKKHNQVSRVRFLFDKKRQTPMDLADLRLKRTEGRRQDTTSYRTTYNLLADIFGKKPLPDPGGTLFSECKLGRDVVMTDREDTRRALELPVGEVTMQLLADVLELEREELLSGRVDTLLLSRVDVKPLDNPEAERSAAALFVSLARACRRVAFVNCTVSTRTATELCRSMTELLKQLSEGHRISWRSWAFPSWSDAPLGGSAEFAEAIVNLCAAMRQTCSLQAVESIDLAPGTATYLPSSHRHLSQILAATWSLKSVARHLLGQSPTDWQETDLWKRIGASKETFLAHNPLLRGPSILERVLLDRSALAVAADVCSCLVPGWRDYIDAFTDCLVAQSKTLLQWAPLVTGRPVDGHERGVKIIRDLADDALLHLLKMRRSRARLGGLRGLAELVGPTIAEEGATGGCFPKSSDYFRRKVKRRNSDAGRVQ
eukprot:TRINITY_DN22071_c0_g1_i1.p1 TRINITY_DN22071_c0_g1~~TRINITY_DN22071_c0_g1_i1.p1  ORF type:complete len:1192 (-),score=144.39 TRINITY_DN22071_c0_g1_i1:88-3636(-)